MEKKSKLTLEKLSRELFLERIALPKVRGGEPPKCTVDANGHDTIEGKDR